MTAVFDKAITATTFIGRAAQLGAFDRLLAQVSTGHSQVVCVTGEAGIGKSRLVAEVWRRAEQQGWQTLQGACFEPDAVLPYAPFIDLLRTHLSHRVLSEVRTMLGPWAPEFGKLLPELALLQPDLQPLPRLDPEADKRRLFDAFVHIFMQIMEGRQGNTPAASYPLLLIIEDLHWCDDTSLEFLRYLARRLTKHPLLLLLTYRSDEIQPTLYHFLAALDREQRPVELALPHFTAPEVDALLRAIFDLQRPVRSAFLDPLYRLTEGNPFFIEEVLKVLVTAGDIFYTAGQWDRKPLTESHIPRTVQDAVQRRTAQLSPAARQVLNLAAVAGRRFDFALLQALTSYTEADLLARMKELLAAQLVIEASADHFVFRHALTQQAVYTGLLARERKALHRTIGETIERLYAEALDAHLADLAYHFYTAEVWDTTLVYAQRAGEQARSLHAPLAAVEHFTRALAAAQWLAATTSPQPTIHLTMQLHYARALAHETLGDFAAARADLETALHLAQRASNQTVEWQARLALGELWTKRDYGQSKGYLQQALALAQQRKEPAILARTLKALGEWYLNAEAHRESIRYQHEALAIYQAANDEEGVAASLVLLGATYLMVGDQVQAMTHLEQVVARFRNLGDQRNLAATLTVLAMRNELYTIEHVVLPEPKLAVAICEAQEAVQLARSIGWRAGEAHALLCLGRVLATTGAYGRALALTQEAYAIATDLEHREWCCQIHFSFGLIMLDLLVFTAAQHHFTQAVRLGQETGSLFLLRIANALLALSYLHQQALDKAEAALNAAERADQPPVGLTGQLIWLVRAELTLARSNAASALDLVDQLIAALPNIALVGECGVPGLALLRGKALATLSRSAEAERALRIACEGAATKGIPSLLWRSQLALGSFYRDQGQPAAANPAFSAARAIIDRLAVQIPDELHYLIDGTSLRTHFLAQSSALFPPPPRHTPRQAAKQAANGLTAREVDVAVQIAQGKANREAAAALVVSERTVETHIRNILAKLGFSSRHQIATWAIEKGLANVANITPKP